MTEAIFETILRMSLTGSAVIVLVLILRAVLLRMPRQLRYLLWLPVLIRLLCPVLPEASVSLFQLLQIPAAPDPQTNIPMLSVPGTAVVQKAAETASGAPLLQTAAWIWLSGAAAMALWSVVSGQRLRHRLREAVKIEKGIFLSDQIETPFIYGFFRPRIFLPCGLSPEEKLLITAHERVHIHRCDPLWRLAAHIALCLHWFNPLVWIFCRLSHRDMEQACDEAVIRRLDEPARRTYAGTLLRFAQKRVPAAAAAFSQSNTKERIENIMNYKKTGKGVLLISLTCILLLAACSLTEPASSASVQPAAERGTVGSSAAVEDACGIASSNDEDALLDEYRAAGIEIRQDGWYYQNQRVGRLTDSNIDNIIRYLYVDNLGTAAVQVVREETPLADGSVDLCGPIVELRLCSEDTDRSSRPDKDDSGRRSTFANSTTVTVQTDHGDSSVLVETAEESAPVSDSEARTCTFEDVATELSEVLSRIRL